MEQQSIFDNEKRELSNAKDKIFKRSLITTIVFILLSIIFFSAQTFAYFTDSADNEENLIQAGKLDIELIEMKDVNGSQEIYTDPVRVVPTSTVSKIVTVKNTGNLPTYIRISIDIAIDNEEERNLPDNWRELIGFDINSDFWTFKDGYYYYILPLEKGHATAPLFETVTFSPQMGNGFMKSEITIRINAEATQVNGNGDDVFTAGGWPKPTTQND